MTTNLELLDQVASRQPLRGTVKRFGLAYKIPAFVVHGLEENSSLSTEIERATRDLVVRLYHNVYSLGESSKVVKFHASFRVPDTWVDALKERFATWIPGWFLRRRPIKYRTLSKSESVTVDARALLPGIPVLDQRGIEIAFTATERPRLC